VILSLLTSDLCSFLLLQCSITAFLKLVGGDPLVVLKCDFFNYSKIKNKKWKSENQISKQAAIVELLAPENNSNRKQAHQSRTPHYEK
jgi:hypothetical protein